MIPVIKARRLRKLKKTRFAASDAPDPLKLDIQ